MALDPVVLGQLIVSKIESETGASMPDVGSRVWAAVAAAIIQHITTAGQVVVTVTSVTGVTAGAGVSGPGTGTGTIT